MEEPVCWESGRRGEAVGTTGGPFMLDGVAPFSAVFVGSKI